MRTDAGFGLHDAHPMGPLDEQVEPQFQQTPPLDLPYDEADRRLGQAQRLAACCAMLRELYTPGAQSPLVDAGDPADGVGADIGAIGVGVANPGDRFGGVEP